MRNSVFFRAMGKAGRALGHPINLIDLEDNLFTCYLRNAWEPLRCGIGCGRWVALAVQWKHRFGWVQMKDEYQRVSEIVRRVVETAQPEKIILFGSWARGDARPGSDFDVLVIQEASEPSYRRDAPLYVALADLPVEVDVLVYTPEEVAEWSQVLQAFVTTAAREGKTVYERNS